MVFKRKREGDLRYKIAKYKPRKVSHIIQFNEIIKKVKPGYRPLDEKLKRLVSRIHEHGAMAEDARELAAMCRAIVVGRVVIAKDGSMKIMQADGRRFTARICRCVTQLRLLECERRELEETIYDCERDLTGTSPDGRANDATIDTMQQEQIRAMNSKYGQHRARYSQPGEDEREGSRNRVATHRRIQAQRLAKILKEEGETVYPKPLSLTEDEAHKTLAKFSAEWSSVLEINRNEMAGLNRKTKASRHQLKKLRDESRRMRLDLLYLGLECLIPGKPSASTMRQSRKRKQ